MVIFLVSDQELMALGKELGNSKREAFASETSRNLRVQWEPYLLVCTYFNFLHSLQLKKF